MRADELKQKAHDFLRQQYPAAHILFEFSVASGGGALIDVAAINDGFIVGVEIKGDGDTAARLGLQGMMYSRVCRDVYLLCSEKVKSKCQKQRPPGWLALYIDADPRWHEQCEKSSLWVDKYPYSRGAGHGLAVGAMAEMIWTKEYRRFGEELGEKLPKRKADCTSYLMSNCKVNDVETAMAKVLRARDWGPLKDVSYPAGQTDHPLPPPNRKAPKRPLGGHA